LDIGEYEESHSASFGGEKMNRIDLKKISHFLITLIFRLWETQCAMASYKSLQPFEKFFK